MRILIDECLDWRLCRALRGHECVSVQSAGWAGLSNGVLLAAAEKQFEVFITGDRNLAFQQNVSTFDIAIIILHAQNTQLRHTVALMPKVVALLSIVEPGKIFDVYP
jgi:predicted nuclease of predicted toxin-antitoxin system